MLLSFCYFASILGLAVSHDVSHTSSHKTAHHDGNDYANTARIIPTNNDHSSNQQFCCHINAVNYSSNTGISRHIGYSAGLNEHVQSPFLHSNTNEYMINEGDPRGRSLPYNSSNVRPSSPEMITQCHTQEATLCTTNMATSCASNNRTMPFTFTSNRTSPIAVSSQQQPCQINCCGKYHVGPGNGFTNNSNGRENQGMSYSDNILENDPRQCNEQPPNSIWQDVTGRYFPESGCALPQQQPNYTSA